MTITNDLIKELKHDPGFSTCFHYWEKSEKSEGYFQPINSLHPQIIASLKSLGINALYNHQFDSISRVLENNKNVVIVTGTASGKSLCYQIPILTRFIETGNSTALMLFPTKALTSDQLRAMQSFSKSTLPGINHASFTAVYDGDTPSSQRPLIRKNAKILLTNPDMLNIALLPHHTSWADYFQQLNFVVIDELHQYRGIFGSHICNIIRRLKRVLNFYGAHPQFILTSATIGNPKELAEWIIEEPVSVVEEDSSPRGERFTSIYNPPFVNAELNIREGLLRSSSKIASFFITHDIQALLFCRTRKFVELVVKDLHRNFPDRTNSIRGYRSGYLRNERREIETGLKNGSIRLAATTNALELGVDIGGVDAIIVAGYPGSISSLRQMFGRSGRHQTSAFSILITSMNPLDQYFARFPSMLFSKPIENALIDANNPLILLPHLQSATFEYPFVTHDKFGNLNFENYSMFLDYLVDENYLQKSKNRYFWMSDTFPAGSYSIRSTASSNFVLQLGIDESKRTIGEIDYNSGLWMCHPGAVYLHDGNEYLVNDLDYDHMIASLTTFTGTYYTEPMKSEEISISEIQKEKNYEKYLVRFGSLEIKSQVQGFKRIDSSSREILGIESLNMPSTCLNTKGFWIVLKPSCVVDLKNQGNWQGDVNDYGPEWPEIRRIVSQRDGFCCQSCGRKNSLSALHIHHKIPFKAFTLRDQANALDNLITLCPDCHRKAELNVKIRNCVSGLCNALSNMAPLLVLCDTNDLGSYSETHAVFENFLPVILLHDTVPGGIGLSNSLFERFSLLVEKCFDLIATCDCTSGCPSCVGPDFENGNGGKQETLQLLTMFKKDICQISSKN
jgi:DEAD/DEAH box helicase domain-containing protein